MPIYVYQAVNCGCEKCRHGWERLEKSREQSPDACPACGAEVERVPATFSAGGGKTLSDSNLKKHGFKKLRKTDDGYQREI